MENTQNRVKNLRKSRGLTQEQLAESVGKAKSQISKLENGSLQLTLGWIETLSKALGCAPAEIVSSASPIQLDRQIFLLARQQAMRAIRRQSWAKLSAEDEDLYIFELFRHAMAEKETDGEVSLTLATAELILKSYIDTKNIAKKETLRQPEDS